MKALIFSDIHIHNYPSYDDERLYTCIQVLDHMFEAAYKNECDVILFAGDLYDQGKKLHPIVVDGVINCLTDCFNKYSALKIVAISGNHDHAGHNSILNPAESALTHLATIFKNRFILIDNSSIVINGVNILGVPYYVKAIDAVASIGDIILRTLPGINILLNHQHHPGCEFGSDFVLENVNIFDYVFTGHIHKHIEYAKNKYSVGSPLFRDSADYDDEKGYLILDTDEHTVERVILSYTNKTNLPVVPIASLNSQFTGSIEDLKIEDIVSDFVMNSEIEDNLKKTYTDFGLNYTMQ